MRAVTKKPSLSSLRTVSCISDKACGRSDPSRRGGARGPRAAAPRPAAGGPAPERAGAQAARGRSGAGGIGDRQPRAVAVFHEVKPVSADLVAGQENAGELGAGDPGDAGREQVLLDLRGGGRGLVPTGSLDEV